MPPKKARRETRIIRAISIAVVVVLGGIAGIKLWLNQPAPPPPESKVEQGFKPVSVCCKSGSIDKLELGLGEEEKVRPNTFEPACNPVAQARLLNRAGTDLNIIVGLCVGHDILFTKYSEAPVTTLVVKDRVAGHNPVSVLYGQNFYYKRLQKEPVLPNDDRSQK